MPVYSKGRIKVLNSKSSPLGPSSIEAQCGPTRGGTLPRGAACGLLTPVSQPVKRRRPRPSLPCAALHRGNPVNDGITSRGVRLSPIRSNARPSGSVSSPNNPISNGRPATAICSMNSHCTEINAHRRASWFCPVETFPGRSPMPPPPTARPPVPPGLRGPSTSAHRFAGQPSHHLTGLPVIAPTQPQGSVRTGNRSMARRPGRLRQRMFESSVASSSFGQRPNRA